VSVPSSISEEPILEVSKIYRHRINKEKGYREFLVLYKNETMCYWIPEFDFLDPNYIKEYFQRKHRTPKAAIKKSLGSRRARGMQRKREFVPRVTFKKQKLY